MVIKHELNTDNNKRHINVGGGKTTSRTTTVVVLYKVLQTTNKF